MSVRHRFLTWFFATLGLGIGGFCWQSGCTIGTPQLPEGLIQANGRIEGDHYRVAAKVGGRVQAFLVREGDAVEAGQVVVQLDDAQTRAKVEQARAALAALQAKRRAAQAALVLLKKQVPLQIDTAEAEVAHSQAALAAAQARAEQAVRDAERFQRLLQTRTVDQESAEQKALARKVAEAEYARAKTALLQAQKKRAEAQLGWDRIRVKEEEIEVLAAQEDQARAVLAEMQVLLEERHLRAPERGIITTRIANLGEVVAAGSPLLDLVDLDRLYLKVYVPSKQIGKVRLGLPARIYTDAFPDRFFSARVRFIAAQAEFTPKEVQTPDERVKLVYGVKLYLDENPDHRLSPGLPADAIIRWREGAPWAKPRW